MPEINQIPNLLPPSVAAQLPLNIRQEMLAGQLAQQQASAPTGPYTSRTVGMLKALEGGLGGLMEGSAVNRAMQGQRQSAQQMIAMADALQQGRGGTGAGTAAPSAPSGVGSDAAAGAGDTTRDLAIRTIYGEAGGESPTGQAGVAAVLKNRLASGQYGSDMQSVIMAPKQFSLWNAGDPAGDTARRLDPSSPAYQRIGQIYDGVMSGQVPDPTNGATHYYNPKAASPAWGPQLAQQNDVTIGNHRFVGGSGGPGQSAQADMPAPGARPVASNTLPPGITPDMVSGGRPSGTPSPAPLDLSAGLAGSDPAGGGTVMNPTTARLLDAAGATAGDIGKGIWSGISYPRDVMNGTVDPYSQEGIGRALGSASLLAGGLAAPEEGAVGAMGGKVAQTAGQDPLAEMNALLDAGPKDLSAAAPATLNPGAASWRLYHGTGVPEDFSKFDPTAPAQRTGGAERGAIYFSPNAHEASNYAWDTSGAPPSAAGARVLPVDLTPGRTGVYDVGQLAATRDPRFMAASRAEFDAGYGAHGAGQDRIYADALQRYDGDVASHRDLLARLGPDAADMPSYPPMSNLLHPQGAAITMARQDGMDSAILRGLGESGGGDQVVALTPGRVRSAVDGSLLYSGGIPGAGSVGGSPPQSRSDMLAAALDRIAGPAKAGPAVVPPPQGSSDPATPLPPAPDPIAAGQMQGRDVAMDPVVPDPQGSLVPPAPSSPNGALQGPQSDAALGNDAPAPPEPSLRDMIAAQFGSGAAAPGPQGAAPLPPAPAPSVAPADLSAGLAGSDPTGGGTSGGPSMPNIGPAPVAAAPTPASPPPQGPGPSAPPPLPMMLGPNVPRSQMLADALMGSAPGGGGAAPQGGPAPAGPSLPQTGPMPPQGGQSASPGSPLGMNPDAPAPGAQVAGPAPLPPSSPPQPLGLAGNSPISDPSSPQSFQRQQMLASALGGGSGGPPPASSSPAPSPAPGGLMGSIGSLLGNGSPSQAQGAPAAPQGGSNAAPASGSYQQARAIAGQILSNPYAQPAAVEMAGKILFPQMSITTAADGKTYAVNPVDGSARLLFDGGAKFDANQSLLQGGKFSQAPAAPMDAAPGHSVITFGANNQPTSNTPIAPTPDIEAVPNTAFSRDKTSGKIYGGVPGQGATDATLAAGNGVSVPQRVVPNAQGGATATPLVPAGGTPGNPLGGAQPLVDQAAKNAAAAAGLKEAATGQVQGAQKFVDDTAKNASAAATHVQELQQLKALSASAPTGWSADVARFTSGHGWVNANGDAVQSYDGLRSYLGTQLRQAGSGALRNSEMDKLSNALGSTDSSPEARAAAVQRIQDGFARQAALGQVAADPSVQDPMAKQAKIQSIQATWQNADAAIEAHPDKRAAIVAKMQANGVPVVGF